MHKLEFLRFADLVRSSDQNIDQDMYRKLMDQCRVLVLSKEFIRQLILTETGKFKIADDTKDIYEPLTMPFDALWIEPESGSLFRFAGALNRDVFLSVKGVLYYETSSNEVYTSFLYDDKATHGFLNQKTMDGHQDARLLYKFLRELSLAFHNKEAVSGEERVNIKQRVGSGKHRGLAKIKSIVRVILKAEKLSSKPLIGAQVDWTHRWEVRGHWRRIEHIGKDKNGNYVIKGLTWVAPFTKGPKEKQFIKKTRVVMVE